jgi:hypothetical protein
VIGHQDKGVQPVMVSFFVPQKKVEVPFVIAPGTKDVFLPVAAGDDMIEGAFEFDAGFSCHAG